jgi:hypothetical protein
MEPVLGQAEEVDHLGSRIKTNRPGFLPDCERGDPNRNESVLAERQAELGMADDLEEETAVPAGMGSSVSRWSAERDTTKYKRPGMEGKFLFSIVPLPADELNRLQLLQPPFGEAECR